MAGRIEQNSDIAMRLMFRHTRPKADCFRDRRIEVAHLEVEVHHGPLGTVHGRPDGSLVIGGFLEHDEDRPVGRREDGGPRFLVSNGPAQQLGVKAARLTGSGASTADPHHIPAVRDRMPQACHEASLIGGEVRGPARPFRCCTPPEEEERGARLAPRRSRAIPSSLRSHPTNPTRSFALVRRSHFDPGQAPSGGGSVQPFSPDRGADVFQRDRQGRAGASRRGHRRWSRARS